MTPAEARCLTVAEFRTFSEYAVAWWKEHPDGR